MAKINELLTTANGVFMVFDALHGDLYKTFFGEVDTTYFDTLFVSLYGERTASLFLEKYKDDTTACFEPIFSFHLYKWKKIYNDLSSESVTATSPYNIAETKTGTQTENGTGESTTTNKEKAFNSTDFVESEQNAGSNSNEKTTTYNITTTRKGNENLNVFEQINNEINTLAKTFFTIFAADMIKYLSLPIYE